MVQLERWEAGFASMTAVGIDDAFFDDLAGHPHPAHPDAREAPGRNIAILVEVAARNQLLRARGHRRRHGCWRSGLNQALPERAWPA